MNRDEKIEYVIKLLIGIKLLTDKISSVRDDLAQKDIQEIDEIIVKLEKYYIKQNLIDTEFMRKLDKINYQIDELVDSAIEKIRIPAFSF
jgi:hypothetical protein